LNDFHDSTISQLQTFNHQFPQAKAAIPLNETAPVIGPFEFCRGLTSGDCRPAWDGQAKTE
jgi:hypothetical protein